MRKVVGSIFAILSCLFFLSCSQNDTEKADSDSYTNSRVAEDIEFEIPITETEEMMDFIENIENIYGKETLITEDGALYVDASYSPLSIRVYYTRINGTLKAAMIITRASSAAASVNYTLELEEMKVSSNNCINIHIVGKTGSPSGNIDWPGNEEGEAEVVINADGDTLCVFPPFPYSVYFLRNTETTSSSNMDTTPFNIEETIPSKI